MLGAIIGDIVGSIYELDNIKTKEFPFFEDRMEYTDDSILTIATADWLIHGGYAGDYYLRYANMYPYPMGSYGTMFVQWIHKANRGQIQPYNSCGNGSAMRIAPVGWAFENEEDLLKAAKMSAECTHNHPEGIKGAQAVACTIWAIRNGYTKDDIKEWLESECKYNLDKTYDELKRTHKFECICQNSVPAAFICWYYSTSYEDCIRKAVSLGGDADTEAAIAGAFAAADPNTEVPEELTCDVTRFFSMDFMDVLKKFHEKYEV